MLKILHLSLIVNPEVQRWPSSRINHMQRQSRWDMGGLGWAHCSFFNSQCLKFHHYSQSIYPLPQFLLKCKKHSTTPESGDSCQLWSGYSWDPGLGEQALWCWEKARGHWVSEQGGAAGAAREGAGLRALNSPGQPLTDSCTNCGLHRWYIIHTAELIMFGQLNVLWLKTPKVKATH